MEVQLVCLITLEHCWSAQLRVPMYIVGGFGSSDGEGIEVEHHHKNTDNFETQFRQDRASLLNSFNQVCNPFQENENELINLYSKHILPESAADSVKYANEIV